MEARDSKQKNTFHIDLSPKICVPKPTLQWSHLWDLTPHWGYTWNSDWRCHIFLDKVCALHFTKVTKLINCQSMLHVFAYGCIKLPWLFLRTLLILWKTVYTMLLQKSYFYFLLLPFQKMFAKNCSDLIYFRQELKLSQMRLFAIWSVYNFNFKNLANFSVHSGFVFSQAFNGSRYM